MVKRAPQPRWRWRVEIDAALADAEPLLDRWQASQVVAGAPLYAGGVWDSWPAYVVDALAICKAETDAIGAHVRTEMARNG